MNVPVHCFPGFALDISDPDSVYQLVDSAD